MATIDSLDIQISGSVKKANQAINSLIANLNRLANSLQIDTNGLEKIRKSLNFSGIDKAAKNIQSQTQKVSKSLSQITEQYKDLGKGFEIKGSTQQIQKQIDTLANKLANAKLAKDDFEASGKTNLGGYETAVKNVIKYTNQIESLKKQLAELRTAQPRLDFNTTGIEEAGKRVSEVTEKIKTATIPQSAFNYNADAMKAVFGEAAAGIENWSQATQKFGANAGAVLNQTTSKTDELKARTEQFEQSLKNLQIPPINTDNINVLQRELVKSEANFEKLRVKLANGITMGRISANVDDKGFRNLKEQMALAEKTAEALREKIKQVQQTSSQTSTGAKKLGDSVKSASKSFSDLASSSTKAIKPLNNLGNSFKSLLRVILPILGIRQLFNWGKQSMQVASDLTEIQNVTDTTFANMSYKVEDFAKTSIEQFGLSELALKQYSSRFQSMGVAMGVGAPLIGQANSNLSKLTDGYIEASDSMADVSLNLTKLTADMASFYNVEQDVVAEKLASVFTGQTRPLRDFGLDLTQATLQEWALKQGMDANIQSMSQAEKTMLRYQYVMANTAAAQGDFARTADTWANQTRILKQNFEQLASVIGGTLINAFKPLVQALNAAMSHIIAFAKTISNALGKIFGWKYEESGAGVAMDLEDGEDYAGGIADGMNSAAGSAKKLRDYVLGIDELNIIAPEEPDSGAGAGGAGGGGVGDYGYQDAAGAWEKTESLFESSIDTLYKLGGYISNTLSTTLENIDWNSVYKKAENFGSGLASFLNGLITPRLFYSLGETVANSINTALRTANAFAITFDWKNLGESLAKGIKGFFENWDAGLTAETFSNFAKGILESMTSFLNTLADDQTFNDMGQKIVDFLCGIDWGGLAWDLIGFFEALSNAAIQFPGDFLEGVAQEIVNKIFGENTEIKVPENFGDKVFGGLINTIPVVAGIKNAIDVLGALKDAIIDTEGNTRSFKGALIELKNNLLEWDGIGEIITGFSSKFTADQWMSIFDGIKTGFIAKWEELKTWFIDTGATGLAAEIAPWFTEEKWMEITNGIKDGLLGKWAETEAQWIIKLTKWWNKNISPRFAAKEWNFPGIKEGLSEAWDAAVDSVKQIWNKFANWLNSKLTWKIDPVVVMGKTVFEGTTINLGKIPTFSVGGFPEDGLFYANHTELVGKFTNGHTAVANNDMIVDGIKNGVKEAVAETLAPYLADIAQNTRETANKDMSVIIGDEDIAEANRRGEARIGFNFTPSYA